MFVPEENRREDRAALRAIATGDHDALLELYDRHVSQVLALAQTIVGPGPDAEEVVRDTFVYVWRFAHRYRKRHGTPLAWLILRTRLHALGLLACCPELEITREPPRFCGTKGRRSGRSRRAHAALQSLDDRHRAVLETALFVALSDTHLARATGYSPQQAPGQLWYAFRRAQRALGRAGGVAR